MPTYGAIRLRLLTPYELRLTALVYCAKQADTLNDVDALIIVTEWKQFRSPDFDDLSRLLKDKVIFDGRNMYEPRLVRQFGLGYYAIGR